MFGNFGQESLSSYDKIVSEGFWYRGKGKARRFRYVKGPMWTLPAVAVKSRGGATIELVRVQAATLIGTPATGVITCL
jgi:hypothetical protein